MRHVCLKWPSISRRPEIFVFKADFSLINIYIFVKYQTCPDREKKHIALCNAPLNWTTRLFFSKICIGGSYASLILKAIQSSTFSESSNYWNKTEKAFSLIGCTINGNLMTAWRTVAVSYQHCLLWKGCRQMTTKTMDLRGCPKLWAA